MRRRRRGDGDSGGLAEARCRWFHARRQVPPELYAAWLDLNPFPGGTGDITVELLSEQAACRCEWCVEAFADVTDPREWVEAQRGRP